MMRPYRTRRRVLRDSATVFDVAVLAESLGWSKVYDVPASLESATDREVTWEVTDGLSLDYLESYLTRDCSLLALGYDSAEAERLAATVESDLEGLIFEEGELLDRIEMADDDREAAHAVMRAGLGAPLAYDDEFFTVMTGTARSHRNRLVRETAICAMVYTEWPQFMPELRRLESEDPDERIRARAAIVRKAYEASGLSQS